ncbi:MAG: 50S ribosomal protein L17 [Omnitrophica WOR_2 bacterium GWF2_43_52]|nr:MAG: 50S ribosomal protein L17 [Omnitrophica WOR_2 bacterium GWC2_44_8]OGX20335.1 MAG: 50S ribosomal protein L17 [Omnitrophica WOR_2 bacterium GWF2_43_52]OGX56429.1 MAG: 50S ribosomal protein L17 [Omnitrophica WOR_2 bacterium RIFOXYC2_FULL_43_9]HAH21230.1 50S ribosomal protein L17 [Candidatus Omnitrophota bacterium]HBG63958.1 50S ribosomal protein L17 [Candidatus Omnitrophota bacterium]
MRHKMRTNRFNRFSSLRKATVNSLARSVIIHDAITTTQVKAKAAAQEVEHLITLAKKNTLSAKRRAFRVLLDHALVSRLFSQTAPLFKERQSGFTRILKTGTRRGDGAQMVILELTEKLKKEKKVKKEKAVEAAHEHPAVHEEKPHAAKEEKQRPSEKKEPTKKFLGGLKGFFKKERDSL